MIADLQRPLRVLIAAGGSGGHIFPALHIARAFQRLPMGADVQFVGSKRPLEEKLIDSAGFKRHVLPAIPVMQRGVVGPLRFLLFFPYLFMRNAALLRQLRPDIVVGGGGYISVMPIVTARLLGYRTWIHEAELRPGLANRVLCYFAHTISTAFKDARMPCASKVIYTGHPVRGDLAGIAEASIPEDAPRRVLIMGGSQGARSLDETMIELAPWVSEQKLEVLHQTRPEMGPKVEGAYAGAGVAARVLSFIDDMPGEYLRSDIVISRSGAGTVMELEAVNRPAILVPYPHAQGGHQLANAKVLESKQKALIIEEGPGFAQRLKEGIVSLLDRARYRAWRNAPVETRSLKAADEIASTALRLILKNN